MILVPQINLDINSMKTKFIAIAALQLFCATLMANDNLSALIPMPRKVEVTNKKVFTPNNRTTIAVADSSLLFEATQLQKILSESIGITPAIQVNADAKAKNAFVLALNDQVKNNEGYQLSITPSGVQINGASDQGIYYGVMTLRQILLGDVVNTRQGSLATIEVDDAPRFPLRALMLDPARHFLPVEDVKRYIDNMSQYKYNALQLHLTDDQGWRIEIKKHPKLTEIGAFRNAKTGKNGPDNGYYTQEQLKDIINYAAERHVEIIPELDIPGHTVAVLSAYPELGCSHTDTMPKVMGTTVNLMLCANNQKVYDVYNDIITEVAALFPSKRIHLGGDEAVIERNWTKCTHCCQMMDSLGYTKASQLMNDFFGKMLASVRNNGKEVVLWCELDSPWMPAKEYLFNYPQDVTLVTWRMGLTPLCTELTRKHGNRLIMAPGEYAYLDYPQLKGDLPEFNNWGMPVTTLKKAYEFDPGYGLPAEDQAHIEGIMGTLWGEAMKDIHRVNYMTYPRALALAEAGWSEMENRGWESFCERLYPNLSDLMRRGVFVRVPFEIVEKK